MYVLFRRWLFLTLLSGGLALLLAPFPFSRTEPTEREVVELRRAPVPLVRESPPPALLAADLAQLHWLAAILDTMDERAEYRGMVPRAELLRLCEVRLGLSAAECRGPLLLRYEGMDLAIEPDSLFMALQAELKSLDVLCLVRHVEVVSPSDLPGRLTAGDLEQAPALLAFLNSYEGSPGLPFHSGVPAGEWHKLCRERGWTEERDFLFGDWHYEASVDTRWVDERKTASLLRASAVLVGLVSLTLSAWLGISLYRPTDREGIPLATNRTAALYDGISALFLALAWTAVIDWLLVSRFGVDGFLEDKELALLAGITGSIAAIVLAWFTSDLVETRLLITDREIALQGLLGRAAVRWDDVKAFTLEDSYLFVGRAGYLVPRRFRRNLRIETIGTPMRVKEPPWAETRARIFSELRLVAPERLQGDLDEIAGSW